MITPTRPLDVSARTERGRARDVNQDQFLLADLRRALDLNASSLPVADDSRVDAPRRAHLMLVADGLGGHPRGERASRVAAGEAARLILEEFPVAAGQGGDAELSAALDALVRSCEDAVLSQLDDGLECGAPGTTLTLGVLLDRQLHVAHVGDSRLYVLRGDRLEQLTTDHAEGGDGPPSHRLWNAVGGTRERVRPEIVHVDAADVEAVLLCSDGLTKHVPDAAITPILRSAGDAHRACRQLVDAAVAGGGSDDITVVVAYLADRAQAEDRDDREGTARRRLDAPSGRELLGGDPRTTAPPLREPDGDLGLPQRPPPDPARPVPLRPEDPFRRIRPPQMAGTPCCE